MQNISRHFGVLCLLFAAALAGSFLLPVDVSSQILFFAATVVFVAYLGVSHLLSKPKAQSDE
jgi:membrane protein implicated in regulation of membrane protease activity